jgi:HTH-type transcriptional regulator/antitoxin MqsA
MKTSDFSTIPDHICPACGSGAGFVTEARDKAIDYKGHTAVIPALTLRYCTLCGEGFDAGNTDMQRMADTLQTLMRGIDTAQAAELRATRKRLGLKQGEAAAIFGGGVNAFSEYERGIRQPSKSTLLLLQLLDRHPELLAEVRQAA